MDKGLLHWAYISATANTNRIKNFHRRQNKSCFNVSIVTLKPYFSNPTKERQGYRVKVKSIKVFFFNLKSIPVTFCQTHFPHFFKSCLFNISFHTLLCIGHIGGLQCLLNLAKTCFDQNLLKETLWKLKRNIKMRNLQKKLNDTNVFQNYNQCKI